MTKQTGGKLSIEGCDNAQEENNYLRRKAKKLVKKHRKFEKEVEHVPVRKDPKTVLLIRREKYLKNKEYYDNLCLS